MISQFKIWKVKNFISSLTHTKGTWSGKMFEILPWQSERILGPAFGTLREDGRRRYRIIYVEVPKKNGKTEVGAAIALYMLCADDEGSPEVYSAAADKEQAGIIYEVAAQMVRNSDFLDHLKILDSRKRIKNKKNSGFYKVLSSDVRTKHGISPSCVLFDELHAQPNDELFRTLTAGTDYARAEQIIFIMTTAGVYNPHGIWWRTRDKAIQVSKKIIKDDSFLPVLYIADIDKDRYDDEELWKRVNPSLGRIFDLDRIRKDFETAKDDPIALQDFLRFRLNIPIRQLSKWIDMARWDANDGAVTEEQLLGKKCFGGIDLSSTQDLTAFELVFPDVYNGKHAIKSYAYCPAEKIEEHMRTDKVNYDVWREQGFMTATPGDYVDMSFLKKDILDAADKYDIQEIGYDPWAAAQLAGELSNEGLVMVEMRQGFKTLSEPAKDIRKQIMAGNLMHCGHPVLRWCVDNVVMRIDPNENIAPDKSKVTGRIDLFVALLNAWGRCIFNEVLESRYNDEEAELSVINF